MRGETFGHVWIRLCFSLILVVSLVLLTHAHTDISSFTHTFSCVVVVVVTFHNSDYLQPWSFQSAERVWENFTSWRNCCCKSFWGMDGWIYQRQRRIFSFKPNKLHFLQNSVSSLFATAETWDIRQKKKHSILETKPEKHSCKNNLLSSWNINKSVSS